jgi:hypothetical protein
MIAWLIMFATIPIFVFTFAALASVVGFNSCPNRIVVEPWVCSASGRLALWVGGVGILLPVALAWAWVLQWMSNPTPDPDARRSA